MSRAAGGSAINLFPVRASMPLRRQVVHVGGNANNGATAGAFYVNTNNDSSNDNVTIGRQLSL